MPTKNEAFPSRWLKAEDIPQQGLALKIAKIEVEKIGTDQKENYVVYFRGQDKALVLNGTNWELIAAALREENSDDWPGKIIELFPTTTNFGAKTVDCIRVRRHRPAQTATPTQPVKAAPVKKAPATAPADESPWDDEVPLAGEEDQAA
jgi:hypothetical protein